MKASNMATTATSSLERSLQNFSLNHHHQPQQAKGKNSTTTGSSSSYFGGGGDGGSRGSPPPSSSSSTASLDHDHTTVELNSHLSLPYHWEQCLDLKTGEIYYINWRTGVKAKEDPRTKATNADNYNYYYSEDDDSDSCDSEESSSESSAASSSSRDQHYNKNKDCYSFKENNVLVVGGCKSCLMYFMVPKQVEDCPKCCGRLIHFDRSENGGSP